MTDRPEQVSPEHASLGDRIDETVEGLLRTEILKDERVRGALWRLAAERPRPSPEPPTSERARAWGIETQRYQQRLAELSRQSDDHFSREQLDRLAQRIRERHPSCVERAPTGLSDAELGAAFALPPVSPAWPTGKPSPRRRRAEQMHTVDLAAYSITARMGGAATSWNEADEQAGRRSDWDTTPDVGRKSARKARERLRRRLP